MMLLVGIEEKDTAKALVIPRRGDSVTWENVWPRFSRKPGCSAGGAAGSLGVSIFSPSTRSGIIQRVSLDPFDGLAFDAIGEDGKLLWGWVANILTINGEAIENANIHPNCRWL